MINYRISLITSLVILFCTAYQAKSQTNFVDSVLHLIGQQPDDTTKVRYFIDLAIHYKKDYDSSMLYIEKCIELSQKLEYTKGISDAYNSIGVLKWYQNNYNEAILNYEKAIALLVVGVDDAEIANCNANIGLGYMMLSDFENALNYYNKAFEIRRQLNNKKGMLGVLLNIGSVYYYQGKYQQSIDCFIQTAVLADSLKDSIGMSGAYNNIGSIYMELNQFDKANVYFNKSLLIDAQLGDEAGMATCLGNMGNIQTKLKNYQLAISYYNKLLDLEKKNQNQTSIAEAYNCLGDVYKETCKFDRAISFYNQSLMINQSLGNKNAETINLLSIADLYNKQANTSVDEPNKNAYYKKAMENGIKAIQLTQATGSLSNKAEALRLLSMANKGLKNFKLALHFYEQYKELNDSLLNSESFEKVAELETKYETTRKNKEIENLQKDNQIKELAIEEQQQRVKAQRLSILLLTTGVILFLLLVLFYLRWNKARNQMLKKELEIRNLRTEQKMLRSQMNPHFIYNSLNSIQSFISANKTYEAEKYLARFAQLMRGILENSREDFVHLDKECEIIEIYLELEQLRFDHKFTFSINIDENIEADYLAIPPMILQPFIENAIHHGVKTIDNGNIDVQIKLDNDLLLCTIADNGIGREAAKLVRSKRNHQSLGIEITHERLLALAGQTKSRAGFVIVDLYDEKTHKPNGTKVEVLMPFIEM